MEKKQPITVRVNQDEPRKVQNVSQADTDELKYPLVVEVPEHPKDLDSSKNNLSKKQLPPRFQSVFIRRGACSGDRDIVWLYHASFILGNRNGSAK
ncbi:hypothetical protein RWE15_24495 [Virgibacillus halophilus]|uniref:Uncharacterized protein n=1 Tax=Tigheibacillus halophilus TaxID=361280 RepID=A0ABU5CC54_9BACI|nr:hypothetical protein [Virgibacillus halophilus]